MDASRVAKADFVLCRVNVNIDPRWIDGEKEHKRWMVSGVQFAFVSGTQRVTNNRVSDGALVEEEELPISLRSSAFAQSDPTTQCQVGRLDIDVAGVLKKCRAKNARKSFRHRRIAVSCRRFQHAAPIDPQFDTYVHMRQHETPKHILDMTGLSPIGTQEFAPRGYAEEQVAYLKHGTLRDLSGLQCRGAIRRRVSVHITPSVFVFRGARCDAKARD